MENKQILKMNKLYLGSFNKSGVSEKTRKEYEIKKVTFLDIDKYGQGQPITVDCIGDFPNICENLVCGDFVECEFDFTSLIEQPKLINITKLISGSLIVDRNAIQKK